METNIPKLYPRPLSVRDSFVHHYTLTNIPLAHSRYRLVVQCYLRNGHLSMSHFLRTERRLSFSRMKKSLLIRRFGTKATRRPVPKSQPRVGGGARCRDIPTKNAYAQSFLSWRTC